MVSKKRRRRELARARVRRQVEHQTERAARRRRTRLLTGIVLGVVAVGILVIWVATHTGNSGSAAGRMVDYHATPAHDTSIANAEESR